MFREVTKDSAQKWPKETTAELKHVIVMSPKATSKLSPQLLWSVLGTQAFQ